MACGEPTQDVNSVKLWQVNQRDRDRTVKFITQSYLITLRNNNDRYMARQAWSCQFVKPYPQVVSTFPRIPAQLSDVNRWSALH